MYDFIALKFAFQKNDIEQPLFQSAKHICFVLKAEFFSCPDFLKGVTLDNYSMCQVLFTLSGKDYRTHYCHCKLLAFISKVAKSQSTFAFCTYTTYWPFISI